MFNTGDNPQRPQMTLHIHFNIAVLIVFNIEPVLLYGN